MLLQKLWDLYQKKVFPVESTDDLYNQYLEVGPEFDAPEAHTIRRENLKAYLGSYTAMPDVLVVGESAGQWAARFSGVPFTSERQLVGGELPFEGRQSSRDDPAVSAGKRPPYAAGSPTVFWRTMLAYYPKFLGWEAVPFYPHIAGTTLKKRGPSDDDLTRFLPVTKQVIEVVTSTHLVAVGERAASALDQLGVEFVTVHHTAHDGKGEFASGMKAFFARLK